ncbi:MAG: endonuclease/exonuclease/phosphatase family protein [Oceanipulchritudo sp.]
MRRFALLITILAAALGAQAGREFTVLVYNVENLFDVDGVALFDQYEQGPEGDYGFGPLLNKLEGIRRSLAAFNEGAGPEVILFQELELDRTPFDTPPADAFLERTRGRSLETILREDAAAANLPSDLLLLKYLDDHGMSGYRIAQPDPFRMESHPPHKNVVFSRFPVKYVRQRPMLHARDLLVAGLDVDGWELILLNNHWKSGASSAATEPIRVQNALVVRAELEAILFDNPAADVIIAGDFNSNYNQKAVFPEFGETGVNDVLRAEGREIRMTGPEAGGLYNLWFELPPGRRGSEVWRGYWGTLMQMVVTPGLYDRKGIQYVDNSFDRLELPGENVETRWGRPVSWSNFGGGAGFSDHLPVFARFRLIPGPGSEGWMELKNPADESLPAHRPVVHYARLDRRAVPDVAILAGMDAESRAGMLKELFRVDTVITQTNPPRIRAGDLEFQLYSPEVEVRSRLGQLQPGDRINAFADLDDWRGALQLVIRDPSWMF